MLHNLGRFFYYLPSAEPVTIRSSFFNDLHTNHRRISTFRTHPPPPYVSAPRTIFKIALNFTFCLSVHFFRPEKMTLEGVIGVRVFSDKRFIAHTGLQRRHNCGHCNAVLSACRYYLFIFCTSHCDL